MDLSIETAALRESLLLNVTESVVCRLDRGSSGGEGKRNMVKAEAVLNVNCVCIKQEIVFRYLTNDLSC